MQVNNKKNIYIECISLWNKCKKISLNIHIKYCIHINGVFPKEAIYRFEALYHKTQQSGNNKQTIKYNTNYER